MVASDMPYIDKAKILVTDFYNAFVAKTLQADVTHVVIEEVYVVWFVKVLQNWKALVATTHDDNRYFEVTYDGDKKQAYVDHYVKADNFVVPDSAHYINQ